MARAAFCSGCNANVYVTDSGTCPQGHGADALSNFYEVPAEPAPAPVASAPAPVAPTPEPVPVATAPTYTPDPSPAATAYAEASQEATKSKSKLWVVLAIVVALLLLCGISSCVAFSMFVTAADQGMSELEATIDEELAAMEQEVTTAEDDEGVLLADLAADDAQRMIEHFYPWFDLETLYTVGEPDDSGATIIHVIAAYKNNPDFRITFFATRATQDQSVGSTPVPQVYYDTAANVWWIHPETRDHGLDSVFGPSPLMVESMLDQISADFVSAHPGKLVSDITALTNMDLGFAGIDESEIDDWYDDGESFESTWVNDIQATPSRWKESNYTEF